MTDQRESERRQRAKDQQSPTGPRRDAEETIKTISGLLAAKRSLLDRPSGLATVAFPDLSQPLGEIVRRSRDLKAGRTGPEGSSVLVDPLPVNLLEARSPDGSNLVESLGGERNEIAATAGEKLVPSLLLDGGSKSVGRGVSVASPPASMAADLRGVALVASGSRPVLDGVRASGLGTTVDQEPGSASLEGDSEAVVRNPLSSDLRNLSLSSSFSSSETTGSPSDHDAKGRGFLDDLVGQAAPPQGATSIDLSKTNELLQQLLDAVTKHRGSSLPAGGPSVYPGR